MFPMTVTLHTADQLNAVLAALSTGVAVTNTCAKHKPADTAKKSETAPAATAPAATQTTAETSAAPEQKAETSAPEATVMSVEDRGVKVKAAITKVGREKVVALLQKYGAAKASEVAADKLPAFDAELCALAA